MAAHRCSQCNTDWPTASDYKTCPFCDSETWLNTSSEALSYAEATQLVDAHRSELRRLEEQEWKMDAAFSAAFLREHGIAPLDQLAGRKTMAPLDELIC